MGNNASAQISATAAAQVSATIVSPVGTTIPDDLSFGRFSTTAKGGVIELGNAGALKVSGGITLKENKADRQVSLFTVTGSVGSYYISLQSGPVVLKRIDGTETMKASAFTISSSTLKARENTVNETMAISARLNVGASQVEGRYTNNTPFAVTVHFN
jgi:hypothetical protein